MSSEWDQPKVAIHRGEEIPFKLSCTISSSRNVLCNGFRLPESLLDYYQLADESTLFEDQEYGQWGLRIFDINDSLNNTKVFKQERSRDFKDGDLIVGEFIGDSDLLLVRCDESCDDFGNVIAVNAIDARNEWSLISSSFDQFFLDYYESQGDKYWE